MHVPVVVHPIRSSVHGDTLSSFRGLDVSGCIAGVEGVSIPEEVVASEPA